MKKDYKKIGFIIYSIVLVVVVFVSLWPTYAASEAVQNYKGDEVWYVDAARNYLYHDHIDVHYITTETWWEGDIPHKTVYEGVNVFVRMPSHMTVYDPDWYRWSNYDPYVANIIKEYHLTNIMAENFNQIIYGRYYLVPKDEFSTFVQALRNVRAPHNITETYDVVENGQTVKKTVTIFTKGEPIFDVRPGFIYADKFGINKYYNLEHPFLGKMFIIAAMYLFGDKPTYWRIPSLLMYYIVMFAVGLAVFNITKRYYWAAIAMLLVAIDPGLRMLGVTGMLDIYDAAFTALAAYAFSKKDLAGAAFFIGLSFASKPNGVFTYLAIIVYTLALAWKKKSTKLFIKDNLKYGGIVLGTFALGNIPVFAFLSPHEWWVGFINGIKWHLSWKGAHPFESPVWNWFFNKNPFTIYFNPRIMIQTNWFLWDLATIIAIVGLFVIYEKYKDKFLLEVLGGFSIVFMYIVMYLLGGKSQYSYYNVQITPFMIIIFTVGVAFLLNWRRIYKAFKGTYFEGDVKNLVPDGLEDELPAVFNTQPDQPQPIGVKPPSDKKWKHKK